MFIKNLNDRILQYFLKSYINLPEDELRALRTSVLIFIQGLFIAVTFAPIHYAAAGLKLFPYSITMFSLCIIALFLIRLPKYTVFARLFFIIVCNFLIFFCTKSIGMQSGMHFFFAPAISLTILMFTCKHNKFCALLSMTMPIFLGALLYFTPSWQVVDFIPLASDMLRAYGFFSTILSLAMVSFTVFYFHRMVEKRDKAIKDKNTQIIISEKLASLGILINGVAHEINNPLSVIVVTASRLKKDMENGVISPEDCVYKIDKINKMADRISTIIQSLNTYNRFDGKSPVCRMSLKETIDQAYIFFKKEMENHGIAFNFHLKNDQCVLGRESDFLQVLINLFSNSIDAIKNGPQPRWINISIVNGLSGIDIIFKDSGDGIDAPIVEKVFDPFFTTKKVGEGTGLGLYICQNLMDSMNGNIEYLSSEINTTFKLRFESKES